MVIELFHEPKLIKVTYCVEITKSFLPVRRWTMKLAFQGLLTLAEWGEQT
jgi:hypothetical protein